MGPEKSSAPAASEEKSYAAIDARGMVKVFGDLRAVDNVDLQVAPGEFFGFLGPNGAGKSTTIRMLTGLLRPTSGSIKIAGYDLFTEPLEVKKRIGVLPEEMPLYDRLSAQEFLEFAGRMHGLPWADVLGRTDELLRLMELRDEADKLIIDYSMGMKKKVALAAALIHNPRVIFLDEPFNGIDAVSTRAIRDVLHRLTERGATIFFSSHILEVVERLCTRVAVINKGRIVAMGTVEELREKAAAGGNATLEDVFLALVDAKSSADSLSWIG